MASDEYLELVKLTRYALGALLQESEPGTGMCLHTAYTHLTMVLKQPGENEQSHMTTVDRRRQERSEWLNRRAAWQALPMSERERLALTLLGDDRLTIRELHGRMQAELPDCGFYDTDTRRIVMNLFKARELDRQGERWRKGNSVRYRYFRRPLDGPIAELERAFHEGGEL